MKLFELLQEKRDWTAFDIINALSTSKKLLKDQDITPEITLEPGEIIFDVPAGEDIAPVLKGQMRPFIIKTQYTREGSRHQYHYFLTRPLLNAEITRIKRST